MKKLMRMKLINWHRFTNCTIDFGGSTLISGENGAGKSTLLDAVQFVILCSANSFNKAAHENGKRKLTGYIRCKTGRESRPYERTGELSAHIALEFYEESRERYFVVGAVVDSATEGQETTVRYLMDNTQFTEDTFLDGNAIKTIAQFRASNDKIKQWCKTQTEARKMIKSRFGRIEDKFFRLIPKALAFKPIDDIKDFVYSYVLDEKEVNIDVLRENVRTYQDLERTLESVKARMAKLEQIEKYYGEVRECLEKDNMYEYFLARAELDIIKENIRRLESEIHTEEYSLKQEKKALETLLLEKEEKQEIETNLRVELRQNQEFLALEEQKKELERFRGEEQVQLEELGELERSVKNALEQAGKLLEIPEAAPCIREYQEFFRYVDEITDVVRARELVEEVIHYKSGMYGRLQREMAELQIQIKDKNKAYRELDQKIKDLEHKKLSYPDAVERTVQAVREGFRELGRDESPRILCELLEIEDESWRNAVEGYLNTQRFYILVEPSGFDIALGIYDRLRREKKAYGVGLINTQGLETYDKAEEGTLARMVTSKNPYAKRFINMLLGKVRMCGRYDELKRYPTSITKECMKYQNRVASAIKPEIFKVPFIGKNAFKVQLEQAREQIQSLREAVRQDEKRLADMQYLEEFLSTDEDVDIKYRLDVIPKLAGVRRAVQRCIEHIQELEENATLIQKRLQLDELEKERKKLEASIHEKNQRVGRAAQRIEEKKAESERQTVRKAGQQGLVSELAAKAGSGLVGWNKEYEGQTEQKEYERFQNGCSMRKKRNLNRETEARRQMTEAMLRYKTEHDFGAPATLEGFGEFAAVYERLRTSELLEYEERVQAARMAAEEEFQEQFLAKLQENMKQAQTEFKELNRALGDIVFSNERYEFLYMPSKRHRSYYEMIMDDFNIIRGESIFSGIFHEEHKEVIEELFERLAMNNESSAKTLDEFTDYRTYMDYDIKIIHSDDSYSYYSKVCEEKSGGETQTPFYVTVAASFVQLYGSNIGGESIGLVMFDEAFNNMDDERIGGVLEFLRRLPLQIIIAAPPDKIQYISPSMEETMLVMTNERTSYVEEYHNDAV